MRTVDRDHTEDRQERWRVFAAAPVNDAVREEMREIRERLQSRRWPMRWVDPDLAHVTVKFYGNVPVASLGELREKLAAAAGAARPSSLHASRIGAFPSPSRPRVIWLGLDGEVDRLEGLAREVEVATAEFGKPEKRSFKPHITIARLRDGADAPRDFAAAVEQLRVAPVDLTVTRLQLIRSVLNPKGPTYTPIAEWTLGAPQHEVSATPELREHG